MTQSGQQILQILDDDGNLGTTIIIETGDATGTGDTAVAEVISIRTESGFTVMDFTAEDPSLGQVASSVSLELNTIPDGAQVKITTSREPDPAAGSAFQLAATNAGMGDISIAYVINVEKTNLENGTNIQSASITMIASREWVEANGGTATIKIIRYDPQTGQQQVLETNFLGYDDKGRAIFEGYSPDGLSMFGLAGTNTGAPTTGPAVTGTGGNWWWIITGIASFVVVMALVWFFIMRRKRCKQPSA
jgi:hypothetical protein